MSGMSAEMSAGLAELERKLHLQQLNQNRREKPVLANTPDWRRYNAAVICAERLIEITPELHCAVITLTSCSKNAKSANERFSRIVGKILKPVSNRLVRFFDRTENGFCHCHIIVALKWPVLEASAPCQSHRLLLRKMDVFLNDGDKDLIAPLSCNAKALQRDLSGALWRAGLGFKVHVEAIYAPNNVVQYVAKYMRGVAEGRRYPGDRRVHLFSASKSAQFAKVEHHILVPGERLRRAKLAAYAASRGCRSMPDAKQLLGSQWAYEVRELLKDVRLRAYQCESDFKDDWGLRFSPEALGVRIFDPRYSPNHREFIYIWDDVQEADRESVEHSLRCALDLPEEVWRSDTGTPSSPPLYPHNSPDRRKNRRR